MNRVRFPRFRRIAALMAAALYCANWTGMSHAQTQAPEPALKAAIIVNMLMFVDWPARHDLPADRLNLCYLNDSPVSAALLQTSGKSIRGKTVRAQQVTAENLTQCHAVYLSPANHGTLSSILTAPRSLPILLVADTPDYFQQGVMLNLEQISGRIVFDINLRSARKAGLQVSSKALRLARKVIE